MNSIIKYLYQNRFLVPKEKKLNRWIVDSKIDDLKLVQQLEEVRTTHGDSWRDEYLLGLVHIERALVYTRTHV